MQIAITGIGIISALGKGVDTNRQLLLEGKSVLRKPKLLRTSHHEWPVGEVRYSNDELCDILGITSQIITRNILLAMVALKETIADARLSSELLSQTPLINGTTVGGMDLTEQHFDHWQNSNNIQLSLFSQHEADQTTQVLVKHFSLLNGVTISTACSSALNAIIHGANMLRSGSTKQIVVGGTEALTKFHLNGFASLGILSTSICRPFQDDRDGINLGEGAAYLVLEDAKEAKRRGAKIYGYLAGYGNACDAFHQTASSPEGDGAFDAMNLALSMTDIPHNKVEYINAHGTATRNNDESELRAIQRLFREKIPFVESTKPLTGHTTSASGSIEAIFTLVKMHEFGYKYAISNAFGFGGNDSSVVFSQQPTQLPDFNSQPYFDSTPTFISEGNLEYKEVIPAMQARRMTPLIRQLLVVSKRALLNANIECPDGIVVGTRWGGMIPTVQLLQQFVKEGEKDFSPALFMNSTHNSAAGILARFLQSKGYNTTVVSKSNPFEAAITDAQLHLLQSGERKRILVCSIDEVDEIWQQIGQTAGVNIENKVQAKVIWLD